MGDGSTTRSHSERILIYPALRHAVDQHIKEYLTGKDRGFPGLVASFSDGPLFQGVVDWILESFDGAAEGGIDYVGGPEAGAWGIAGALARALNPRIICDRDEESKRKVGLLMIQKYEKPEDVPEGFVLTGYETDNKSGVLAIPRNTKLERKRLILIDDWAETYTQLSACADLVKTQGGIVAGAATIVAVSDGRERFLERHPDIKPDHVFSLVNYKRNGSESLELVE